MTRPMLTQREAAAACGVSRTTIRRRREAGDLPGSYQDPERGWVIPVGDLLAAGFRLNAPNPPEAAVTAPAGPVAAPPGPAAPADSAAQDAAALQAELAQIRAEHALALARAEYGQKLAEAEAQHLRAQLAERGERISDLQRAVAALAPAPERAALAPPPAGPAVPGQAQGEQPETGSRRRWWGGRS